MKRIKSDSVIFCMSGKNQPADTVQSGEMIVFETADCFSGQIHSEAQNLAEARGELINPATGPLYIEGAEPGDILKVKVIDILLDAQGVIIAQSGDGPLGGTLDRERIRVIPIKNNRAIFNEILKLNIKPMIGVIGTAAEGEGVSTVVPGSHGGNMDCRRITKGAAVYLPVNVPGALLAMGDLHAIMADGEVGGCGLEISGEVIVKVDVIKNKKLPLPMIMDHKRLITVASEKTLDEAANKATLGMYNFLTDELCMEPTEAAMLLSLQGDLRVCQIVDPEMTARMEIPLSILQKYHYDME